MGYSRSLLLSLKKPDPKQVSIDFSFMNNPDLKDIKPRKRGKRGGVAIRLRRRKFRLPLPTILLGNAQSLNNKISELSACCRFLSQFREANVIALSETWLKEEASDPDIPGFSVYRQDRSQEITQKKVGGGVCLFINDKWCTNVTVKESTCLEDIELLSVALRPFYLPREFNQIFITIVYIHPRANFKNARNKLKDTIDNLTTASPDAPCFVMGDFNRCKMNQTLPTFKQYVTCATCGDNSLDLCYGNIKEAFKSHLLPKLGRSIHNMVQLLPLYRQKIKREKPKTKTIKMYTTEAVEALKGCYDCTDWSVFTESSQSLDEATEVVSDYINFCVDLVIPTKQVKIYPNTKPWETKELKNLLHERQEHIKDSNDEEKKKTQKKIDNCIKKGKKQYKDKLEKNFSEGRSQQSWENMATITGYKKKRGEINADNEEEFSNELNKFYTRFDSHDYSKEQNSEIENNLQKIDDPIQVKERDVENLFKKLNHKSASGPDNVASKTLKLCSDSLAKVYTLLMQWSFNEHYVPRLWKTSVIVPVPKKKSPTVLNDYRPVALTSVPMKCAEKIALKELRKQTAAHQDPMQFAYCAGRSTEDAILTMLHHILTHLDRPKSYVRVLFIDFSSAFNTIQPHLLMRKLSIMEVSPSLILWICSFMTNRPQQVRIGTTLSSTLHTNTGAPQGCVLSPALFTTYTADSRSDDPDKNIQIKFADDTSLSGLIVAEEGEQQYRQQVDKLVTWCDENHLDLNIKKTEEMVIDFRVHQSEIEPLSIKGEDVRIVHKYKYLGTIIDDKLDWGENIDMICKKTNQRLFFLRKLNQFKVSTNIKQLFYQSVVESMLLYNNVCYFNSANKDDTERMEKATKSAAKVIGTETRSIREVFEKTSLTKLQKIESDPSHPLNEVVTSHKSKRVTGRFISMNTKTARHANSYLPNAIRLSNALNKR